MTKIAVIGLGYVGLPACVRFARAGVEVLGLKGLVIGPVIMSLAIAILRLYATETRLRRHLTR